ncbi:hypothetical protein ACFU44_13775 [Nocardia rhizosphaerihabitans]|uniref:hypothetical protein n=1 Tax=Nocardia rhizosphaerihabitans TaxID=1691570 RepID=UPI00366B9338
MANPAFSTRYRLPDGRLAVNVTEAKTLAAEDSGLVQNVTVASVTVTLPATATVGTWTIRDGGVKATSGPAGAIVTPSNPTVDPNASDTVAGLNVEGTEADGKYLKVSASNARFGDEITITNGPTNGGYISRAVLGDWEREA